MMNANPTLQNTSLKRYAAYKDSGVEWLGEIPEHWFMWRSKRLFSLRKDRASKEDRQLTASQKHGVIYQDDFMEIENRKVMQVITGSDILKKVEPNDFVISMRSFQGGLEWSPYRGAISSAYVMLKPSERVISGYFRYLFKSRHYIEALQSTSNLVRDGQALRYDNFIQVDIPLPPQNEQENISRFLDQKTASIDTAIAKKQRLIELLKEQKAILINRAVTRGLNPDVPMKDSGVEWIGEIPAHWDLIKLKHCMTHVIDCPHETPKYSIDGKYLVIRTANVFTGRLDMSGAYSLDHEEYINRTRRSKLEKNDIVYGREGERWGFAALVPDSNRYCLGQRMMQFRSRADFSPGFLMWTLNSQSVYLQGSLDTVGATSPHVNISTIKNYILPNPPLSEQIAISNKLNDLSSKILRLINSEAVSIKHLNEYKQTLIAHAVTGKIKV